MINVKILYAEDECEIRQNYVTYLKKKYDFEILEAKDGVEAFELYLKHKPKLLLTDIIMPKMCGLSLIKKIRKIDQEIKIIALSAHDEPEKLLAAIELNLISYQVKPINRKKLLSSIDKAIKPLELLKYYFDKDTFFDIYSNELISNNNKIKLSKYEVSLLTLFINNKNKVISSEFIFDNVWSDLNEFNQMNIRTLVKKLRKKLPTNIIETLYGGGYKLVSL